MTPLSESPPSAPTPREVKADRDVDDGLYLTSDEMFDRKAAGQSVMRLRAAIVAACRIIETADARNLANDGPAGGFPPQMGLKEWRTLYVTLDKARNNHV